MYTLVSFATEWGSKFGGINSFNADFLTAFGAAYHHSAEIICVVAHAPEVQKEVTTEYVNVTALPYAPEARVFDSSIGEAAVDLLRNRHINFDPDKTIWLGHDLITGEAAVAAAKMAGGRSAVIHHMSYDAYETYAEDTESANTKTAKQIRILKRQI